VRVVPILRTGQDVGLPAHGSARTLWHSTSVVTQNSSSFI
jgi:hypothetical protein